MMYRISRALALTGIAMLIGGAAAIVIGAQRAHAQAGQGDEGVRAICVLVPTEGNTAHGTVRFEQSGESVTVTADIAGLKPGSTHAWHIHEFGDISDPQGMAAGGHYNPEGHPHALPDSDMRHAGDLGNLEAGDDGTAHAEITVHNITILGAYNPVAGRAMIIHADPDDGGQPTGNAGGRIAQGVIGIGGPAE